MTDVTTSETRTGVGDGAALSMLEALPNASVLVLDRALRCVVGGGSELARHGLDAHEIEGRLAERVLGARWELCGPICRAALAGETGMVELEDSGTGARQRFDAGPLRDPTGAVIGCVAVLRDVAEQAPERTRQNQLNARLMRIYALVVQANSGIVAAASPQEMYGRLCELAVREGGFSLAWVGELNRETGEVAMVAASGTTAYLDGLKISVANGSETGLGPTGRALHEGRAVVCNDIANDPSMEPWRERALAHGIAASAAFPLLDDEFAPTALMVYAPTADFFVPEELELLEYLASDTAIVLRARQRDAERFRLALAGSGLSAFTMDRELRYTWMENPSLGLGLAAVVGHTDAELMPLEAARSMTELKRRVIDAGESIDEDFRIDTDEGTLWFRLSAHPLRDPSGAIVGLAGHSTDVTTSRAAEERERETQEFLAAITQSMAEGMFAVDNGCRLTYINDAGEQMLGWTADELFGEAMHAPGHYRRGDGSPYAPGESPFLHAVQSGETARVEDDMFVHRDGRVLAVAYSVSPMTVGGSRGSVVVFNDVTERKAEEARLAAERDMLSWVGRVRDALDEDRFVLYAQPIVDLRTDKVVSHELLIRMLDRRGGGGVIAPDRFLPAAERYGLISEIDEWVIAQAAQLAGAGHAVEFNLSASSLAKPHIVASIATAFREAGANTSDVVCEITETALLTEAHLGRVFAEHLSSLGFGIALDDFGTGYGGLTYLTALPLTHVKIDRSFVTGLPSSKANRHLVQAIVSLAQGFEKKTVAEGVEDEETLALLKSVGVDYAQGYYLGRPAPLAQALAPQE